MKQVEDTEAEIAAFNHASIAITTEAAACAASDDKYARMVRAKSDNGVVRQVPAALG